MNKLPKEANPLKMEITSQMKKDAQKLFSVLLSPEVLAKLPKDIIDKIVPIIKASLIDSLQLSKNKYVEVDVREK